MPDVFSDIMLRLQGVKTVETPRVSREVRPALQLSAHHRSMTTALDANCNHSSLFFTTKQLTVAVFPITLF